MEATSDDEMWLHEPRAAFLTPVDDAPKRAHSMPQSKPIERGKKYSK